ncbi:hypothetical protein DYB36_005387, partial [Aphanomyces astaci]
MHTPLAVHVCAARDQFEPVWHVRGLPRSQFRAHFARGQGSSSLSHMRTEWRPPDTVRSVAVAQRADWSVEFVLCVAAVAASVAVVASILVAVFAAVHCISHAHGRGQVLSVRALGLRPRLCLPVEPPAAGHPRRRPHPHSAAPRHLRLHMSPERAAHLHPAAAPVESAHVQSGAPQLEPGHDAVRIAKRVCVSDVWNGHAHQLSAERLPPRRRHHRRLHLLCRRDGHHHAVVHSHVAPWPKREYMGARQPRQLRAPPACDPCARGGHLWGVHLGQGRGDGVGVLRGDNQPYHMLCPASVFRLQTSPRCVLDGEGRVRRHLLGHHGAVCSELGPSSSSVL